MRPIFQSSSLDGLGHSASVRLREILAMRVFLFGVLAWGGAVFFAGFAVLFFGLQQAISLPGLMAASGLTVVLAASLYRWVSPEEERAQTLLLVGLALHIGMMSFFTGGLHSAYLPFLLLLPMLGFYWGDTRLIALAAAMSAIILVFNSVLPVLDASALPTLMANHDAMMTSSFVSVLLFASLVMVLRLREVKWRADVIEQSETQFRFLTENAIDVMTRHGSDGVITYASPAIEKLLAYDVRTCVDVAWSDLVHPDDRGAVENALTRAGYFGADSTVEYRMRHAAGHYVWVETNCRPVLSLEASRLSPTPKALPMPDCFDVICVTRDVSERQRYEEDLREDLDAAEHSNQAKSQFLASMSHELRTPLNAIIGFADMISAQTFGPIGSAKYLEYAHLIHQSGHHLLNLINDVLDLAKIEAGKYDLDRDDIDVPALVAETMQMVSSVAKKGAVNFETIMASDLPMLSADKKAVRQILLNLLSNAIKFTPEGGTVTVAASVEQETYFLQVADTGIGISKADLERLGQPYEQVKASQKEGVKGTGLGLSLVKSMAQLHGGEVSLASAVGKGTCVSVTFPLANPQTLVTLPERQEDAASETPNLWKGAA